MPAAQTPRTDAQAIAEAVRVRLEQDDPVMRALGIDIDRVAPGYARTTMTVRHDMINGVGVCHGGLIATLADTAFAFACNSHNETTLTSSLSIEFLAPGHAGDRLIAEARELWRRRHNGLYDVLVTNQDGVPIAAVRGRSHGLRGRRIVEG